MSGIEMATRYADDPQEEGYKDDPESGGGGEVFEDEGGLQTRAPKRRSCFKTVCCVLLLFGALGAAFGAGIGLDWDSLLSSDQGGGDDGNNNNGGDTTPAVAPPVPPPEGGIGFGPEPEPPAEPVPPETPAEEAAPETPEAEISGVPPPEQPEGEPPAEPEGEPPAEAEEPNTEEAAAPADAAAPGYAGDGFESFSDVPIGSSGVTVSLPQVTTTALQNDASPQAKALHWMAENYAGRLDGMEDWRKQQIFAMATIYYGVGGDEWHDQSRVGWMDANKPECSWCAKAQPCESNYTTELYMNGIPNDSLPPQIGLLTKLETLDFLHNREANTVTLETAVPVQITRLADSLTSFTSNKNGRAFMYMVGTIPDYMWSLTKLTKLDIRENLLTGTISDKIGGLTDLKYFDVASNKGLTGLPTTIGNCKQLEFLDLRANRFTLPEEMGELTKMTTLHILYLQLQSTFPSWITRMTNLVDLSMDNNKFTGPIPTTLGLLTNLQNLYLQHNQFTGKIPSQLGLLTQTKLVQFWLAENQFTGPIPLELFHLDPEEKFELKHNQLTGTIPTQIGLLTSTHIDIDFGHNKFVGTIPTQVGLLTNLEWRLDFSENELTGTVPTQLGNLAEKYKSPLVLKSNKLVGPIPPQLGQLTLAKSISLEGNNFPTQQLPDSFCNLPQDAKIDVDCDIITCPTACSGYCQCK